MTARFVTVNTVQGIGDIFWVYQKLAPYFDTIHLNILCVNLTTIQMRAQEFCKMLPKVGKVAFVKAHGRDYQRVAYQRFSIESVLHRAPGPVEYAVNAPLEVGVNLRDVDSGTEVETFVDLGLPATVERDDSLCVFVAGAKLGTVWRPSRWAAAITRLARRMDTNTIRLIGASWDQQVQDEIFSELRATFDVKGHVGANLAETIGIIRESRLFFGYQSGLNVIAENYDVPQLMVYFPKLGPMLYTWCKPGSVLTTFHATTFADDIDAAIDGLPLENAVLEPETMQ